MTTQMGNRRDVTSCEDRYRATLFGPWMVPAAVAIAGQKTVGRLGAVTELTPICGTGRRLVWPLPGAQHWDRHRRDIESHRARYRSEARGRCLPRSLGAAIRAAAGNNRGDNWRRRTPLLFPAPRGLDPESHWPCPRRRSAWLRRLYRLRHHRSLRAAIPISRPR